MKIAAFRSRRTAYEFLRGFNWMPAFEALGHQMRYSTEFVTDDSGLGLFSYQLESLASWCDILMTSCEILDPRVCEKIVELRNQHGFKLVCDNDDPLSIVQPHSQSGVELLLREADLVTFISDVLAEDYGHMARRWIVQPTCVPSSAFDIEPMKSSLNKARRNLVIMGWPYHFADLDTIREDVERLLDSGDYRLITIGIWSDWLAKYDSHAVVKVAHIRQWEKLIAFMKGIPKATAIVPVRAVCQETRYNNNAKFLDYTLAGIPMIVSDVPNYDFLRHGREVFKVAGSWADAVNTVSENATVRKSLCRESKWRLMHDFTVEGQAPQFMDNMVRALGVEAAA